MVMLQARIPLKGLLFFLFNHLNACLVVQRVDWGRKRKTWWGVGVHKHLDGYARGANDHRQHRNHENPATHPVPVPKAHLS